jgi:thioredoxin reductase (NADPH)
LTNPKADVVVIGAGPVGLFAVFQCGMLRMRCDVIDMLDEAGGQCTALYPEKPIYDIPAYPRITAGELVEQLRCQAAPFRPTYHLGETVTRLAPGADQGIEVALSSGRKIDARAVIIAAGGGALRPNRPPLEGIENYEGRHVIYRVTQAQALKGRRVVIAGGGDSAVDWANALAGVAEKVMLVHRRTKFRAAPASVDALMQAASAGHVELVTPYQLHALQGDGRELKAVTVTSDKGETRDLQADTLLALFGLTTHLGPIAEWGLQLQEQQIGVSPETCETSIPGVYAVGDVAAYPGKLKLILTGFAEVAMAAHAIFPRVHPGKVLHFEHSTNVGVPPIDREAIRKNTLTGEQRV